MTIIIIIKIIMIMTITITIIVMIIIVIRRTVVVEMSINVAKFIIGNNNYNDTDDDFNNSGSMKI